MSHLKCTAFIKRFGVGGASWYGAAALSLSHQLLPQSRQLNDSGVIVHFSHATLCIALPMPWCGVRLSGCLSRSCVISNRVSSDFFTVW